jgi:hypothetical protein
MIRTVLTWMLLTTALLAAYALVVTTYSGRAALNSSSGTPIYAQTCHDAGFDPLEGQP